MNKNKKSRSFVNKSKSIFQKFRRIFTKKKCSAFNISTNNKKIECIEKIYVINLDRQPNRYERVQSEFSKIMDISRNSLTNILERVTAVDAINLERDTPIDNINSKYTLGEQLFVDPCQALPKDLNLDMNINMSKQEIAVALSHIKVWEKIASGAESYALVIEDDICLHPNFSSLMEKSWNELIKKENKGNLFDILFLSFKEVDLGAEKVAFTYSTFKLFRGIWYMSGYVLSKEGARKLIEMLPLNGPVDMWINHKFNQLTALMTKKSIIPQRSDEASVNFYSVLPVLSKIGLLNDTSPSVFKNLPTTLPVFAIGKESDKLTSLSMALSMLGFKCCSDLSELPKEEKNSLIKNLSNRKFNAYVNIKCIEDHLVELCNIYPKSYLIIFSKDLSKDRLESLKKDWSKRVLVLNEQESVTWKPICEFFGMVPPVSPFPKLLGLGQRKYISKEKKWTNTINRSRWLKSDESPWIIPQSNDWNGLDIEPRSLIIKASNKIEFEFKDILQFNNSNFWSLRKDTFPGNECMFDPSNFSHKDNCYIFTAKKQNMEVREYSSAAITSNKSFLYGRFESKLKPPKVSGFVTGMFLHRDSPRQEIDIEFTGNNPTKMLTNVYYNPGVEGARFDYGYRGTPLEIELGFDASEDYHLYAIEWDSNQIRWYVDNILVHTRNNWGPTPIPHLPMKFHINLWPTKSRELAGRIDNSKLPSSLYLKSVQIKTTSSIV
jgi:GR25 family glycosyltransferase involved in LPS biosynthesis